MKKRIALSTVFGLLFSTGVFCELPSHYYPTEEEIAAMLREADDFIDDMPEGLQDCQSDAVRHALRGQLSELQDERMRRNKKSVLSDRVERIDFTGDGDARGIAMRLYKPKDKENGPLPLLVYFHGGGWALGSIESCARFCDSLASSGKAMVLAVDYSLAPENPYPKGLYDCVGVVKYAMDHAAEWGSDSGLVSLGGDSSGGNLALAAAMRAEEFLPEELKVKSLILFYPVVKAYADNSKSWKTYSRGYGLDSRLMEAFNEAYLSSSNVEATAPDVSPGDSSDEKLSKMPRVLLISAERDILTGQGKEFIERLQSVGSDADRIEFPGAVHLFITVEGQPTAFGKSVAVAADFLSK